MIDQKSIAVLPFDNLSSDSENEYFSDGITEEIINALSKIGELKVTARTSTFAFKKIKKDVRHIGNELGVALVLEGSVRKVGEQVRITTQLIRTDNGFHIWSENFDRKLNDIFALQDEISLLVADKTRESCGHFKIHNQLVTAPTSNLNAYELFLKANHLLQKFNRENLQKAIALFKDVVTVQPDFALAHANIHYAYNAMAAAGLMPAQEALHLGKKHLDLSYELDNQLPQYYHSMGWHSLNYDWDFIAANRYLYKAIELNPNYAEAHQKLFINQSLDGNLVQAKYHIDKALEIDPLSPLTNYFQAYYHYLVDDFKQADYFFDRTFNFDPYFLVGYSIYSLSKVRQNDVEPIYRRLDKMPAVEGAESEKMIMNALASLITNDKPSIQNHIHQLRQLLNGKNQERVRFFLIYIEALGGTTEHAFNLIDEGIQHKEPLLTLLKVDPLLKPLHHYPRFQEQLKVIFKHSDATHRQTILKKKQPLIDSNEIDSTISQLNKLLTEEKVFTDGNLSIRELAKRIQIHPNKLSRILNEVMGKSFNDFINGYRLEEFQKKALEPDNHHLTLLGIAFESGFNSKSVFNEFFKKNTGLTPKVWVKQARSS